MHDVRARESGRILPELALYSLAAGALLLMVGAAAGKPFWALKPQAVAMPLLVACTYFLVAAGILIAERRSRVISVAQMVIIGVAAAVPILALGVVFDSGLSRKVLLGAAFLPLGLLMLGRVFRRYASWGLVVAAIVAMAGLAVLLVVKSGSRPAKKQVPDVLAWQLRSSLYPLSVASFRNYVPSGTRDQGGITLFGDRYLLTNGDGDLVLFQPSPDGRSLEVEPLAYKAPINISDFVAAAGASVNTKWFRVADVLAQETNGEIRVFVTHHYWKVREKCWVMRVSSLQGPMAAYRSGATQMAWKTVFESNPCLPLARENEPPMFSGIGNGGRMVLLDAHRLLVSIGDHEMDGWKTATAVSQDKAYSHGKMILINLDHLSSEIYTIGQRNPQGLAVSDAGLVWSTEHGPEGGDELNLIEQGGNYGWPNATYGTEYGTHSWPLSPKPGNHDDFKQPFYSWVPSIGISSLIEVTSPGLESWRGDLLVGALKDQAFWRLRIRENRVVMVERIPFGERIRDVLQGHRGELVAWTDKSTLHFIAPSEGEDAESGESIYRSCAGCHVAPEGSSTAVGPDLQGIVGRAVAADKNFAYSPALRAMGGVWTEERLDAFLKSPGTAVPGTSMVFTGVPNADSRRKLIEYLASPASRLDRAPPTPL